MEHEIKVGNRCYIFETGEFDTHIDIEKEITVDYSNLAGDSHVTPLVANFVGNLKADLEEELNLKKLEISVWESEFKKEKRKNGAKSGDKVTEKALETLHCAEDDWFLLKNEEFKLEANLKKVENFYWRLQHKLDKLNMYQKEVMPDDFTEEIIEKALAKSPIRVGGLGR